MTTEHADTTEATGPVPSTDRPAPVGSPYVAHPAPGYPVDPFAMPPAPATAPGRRRWWRSTGAKAGIGYVTEETQTGKVTALGANSLTVLSTDGYTRSYTITSGTVSGVSTGTTVRVLATVAGNTATATRVQSATTDNGTANGGTVPN
jgi:hypothetical protein